jgi:UDP-N-acetyl-D-mannosaminuronic acid dehydrogenase
MRISVVGLGYIGLPTAIMLADAGHDVFGFDINEDIIGILNTGQIHIKEENLQKVYERVLKTNKFKAYDTLQEAEIYIIAVPTPFKNEFNNKCADLAYIDSASELISNVIKKDDLVILESTSPPLTTKRVTDIIVKLSRLNRDEFYIAYCPERVIPGKILFELENNDRIIGAEKKESALKAKELYQSFVKNGNIFITDDITAEMAKLVENSYRDVNIAFANELSIICDKLNIDVNELIMLANKHPRVDILSPGIGVGGHCISVDPWFIVEKFKEAKLIKTAREVNDNKPFWICDKIEKEINYDKTKTIGILGLAYKPNVDDLRESPSIIVAEYLYDKGYKVIACEPNTRKADINGIKILSLDEVMQKSDLILLAQRHDEFCEMDVFNSYNDIIYNNYDKIFMTYKVN